MYRTGYWGWGLLAAGAGVWAVLGIAAYILTALGLYKIAQKQGEPNAWLAWIPIAQLYIIGKIIKEVKIGTLVIPRMELILPLAPIAISIVGAIPFIGAVIAGLAGLAYYALFIYTLYLLFNKYVPDQAVLYTVLSAIGLFAIFIFIIRDKEPVE